jgi:hypothetical protein
VLERRSGVDKIRPRSPQRALSYLTLRDESGARPANHGRFRAITTTSRAQVIPRYNAPICWVSADLRKYNRVAPVVARTLRVETRRSVIQPRGEIRS